MSYILGVALLIAAFALVQFGCNFVAQRDASPALRGLVGGDIYALLPTVLFPCGVATLISGPAQAMNWTSGGELILSIAVLMIAIPRIRILINRSFQVAPTGGPGMAAHA